MFKISRKQKLQRWDGLPLTLREALFSEKNFEYFVSICQKEHLSEDKIKIIGSLAGDVILGFIHPEDLTQEIKTALNINQEIADSVSKEINRKIFNPLKADIDGVYAPVPEEIEEEKKEIKIVDIEPPKLKSAISIIEILQEKQEESEKKSEEAVEPLVASPSVELMAGEVEPLIIHKEEEIKTVFESRLPKSLGGLFGFLKRKQPEESMGENFPAAPAKIEIGDGVKKAPQDTSGQAEGKKEEKVRVVHYGGLSTPLPPAIIPKTEIKIEEKIEQKTQEKIEEKKVEEKKEESKPEEEIIDLREFK